MTRRPQLPVQQCVGLWRASCQRRNDVIRIASHRPAVGSTINEAGVLALLAVAAGGAPKGRYPIKGKLSIWPGLCPIALARRAGDAGLGKIGYDDPRIADAIEEAASGRTIGPEEAGRILGLTAELRDLLRVTTIEAIDESRENRIARHAEEARVRNREKKRASRLGKHKPRAETLEVLQPWKISGISRSKFYKIRSSWTDLSPEDRSKWTDLSGGLICPAPSRYTGWTDKTVQGAIGSSLQRSEPRLCPSVGAGVPSAQKRLIGESRPPESASAKKDTDRPSLTDQEEAAALAGFISGLFLEEVAECDSGLAKRRTDLLGKTRVARLFQQVKAIAADGFKDMDTFEFLMKQARELAIRLESNRGHETTGTSIDA